MKYVHTYSDILFSFVKFIFEYNRNNNNSVKTLKIIKKIIFALFVLEKIKRRNVKKLLGQSNNKSCKLQRLIFLSIIELKD